MISQKEKSSVASKNIEAIYPLSPMQQGMLFHSLYAPESGVYVEQMTLTLKGDVNVAAFESAWQTVVDRYSILRTLFIWENRPTPLQIVLKQVDLPWTNLDWLSLSPAAQQQQLSELLHTQRTQGFAFDRAPLMGCTLIQLTDDTYQLIWNSHHILLDGWCLPIIFNEVLSFYEAQVQGEICHLPTPTPYEDYIDWLTTQDRAASTEFWRQMLQGFSAPTPLVVGRTVPQSQQPDSSYRELEFRLSTDVSRKLQALAQQHHLTLSTIIQAAWGLLLSRYSGEQDILFGVTVSGRPASLDGVEKMVGLFINTLPLRLHISPNQQLISWLEQIQQLMLELQQFSYTPLVEIQSLSEVVGGIPLFESIVVFENYPMDSSLDHETGSLQVGKIESREQTNFPLTVAAASGNELSVQISYDAVRFAEDTIERMLGHLQTIFSAIATNPHQTLSELPLLSESERHQLLLEWNDTQTDYPQDKCIHQLFEEQVAKTPDAIAVVFEQQELTYQQLNQRANQLAHHLQTLGVKPEVLVGICVERSLEMVVGLLGILKAGGAYVPLDPSYPPERLSYMLSDAGIEVLLTQDNLLTVLPSHAARVVCLDTDGGVIESHRQDNLVTGVSAENLAYVIYTSGSTGQPKGVTIPQRNLVQHGMTMAAEYHLTASDRVLQFAALSFDVALEEIWPTWLSGATVVLRPQEMFTSVVEWVDFIDTHNLTVLNLPAAFWQEWIVDLSTSPQDLPSCLRLVIVGSEQVQWSRVALWQKHVPSHIELYNAYGVTEATITTTVHKSDSRNQQQQTGIVPIGRPIANTQVYILDSQLQPVPIGVAGELHIGGDGLARGYLNRPELTQAKFVANPFSPDRSTRLYKTGDLARYLPDGNIEFLGRIDHQVKIRGFRIELGEIEAVLSSHPQIQQAVVIATEDIAQTKRLVAYAVSEEETLSTQQLREFLHQQIPAYMVPSAFVILDTLPLTPNGKVDRKALPAPDIDIERTQEYVAPHTPNQEIIAYIFTTVLGVEAVSIHDNFFELGGHSLLATQLTSRLKQSFTVDIPLRAVFEAPTVAQLERTINQLRTQAQGWSLPAITRIAPQSESIPLSFAQERLWFLNQLEGASATYNMPAALRLTGELNLDAFDRSLAEIIRRHEALRTSFPTVNGTPMQVIHPSASMTIETIDLQQLTDTERKWELEQQIQQSALTPFDLEIAPLIRCRLLQLSATDYVFCINMHHIVSDGWSIGVLVQELSALYTAYYAGNPSPLPELEIQYVDFALWQRQWLSGEVLEQQLEYWVSQLQGAPELLQLPTDRPRPSVQTYRGATHSLSLSVELTQKLQALSRQTGSTLFMTLMAAFATLLYRYSGQSDMVIGSPIANRNRSEIEPLIGFFVNTLVLRTQLEEHLSFEQLLKQVRATTLTAYEHQDLPFEQIVDALQPQRSMSHSPLFQVMFALQNAPMGEIELAGMRLTELDADGTMAKFDLTLSMTESAQGLDCEWEYNIDLFDRSTIERMASHFENLLSAIIANPQQVVSELPLLSPTEQNQLLFDWNDTQTEYPQDKCIHQLFEEQVTKTPDAIAVVFEREELTYQQLNERANQLAHYLQTLGVKPEVLVGICVERSLEMVVGLLGILKAGGAYVPLDPSYPTERLSYMVSDAGVKVLLTQENLLSTLPSHVAQVVCVNTDGGVIESHSPKNLVNDVRADNLADVIYTSGSTGEPKGVCVAHRSVVRLVQNTNYAQFNAEQVFLQLAPITFDASTLELWGSLLHGSKLVIFPSQVPDLDLLVDVLYQHQITCLWLTAGLFHLMVDEYLEALSPVQQLLAGGDVLSVDHVQRFRQRYPNCRLIDGYGPTENTTFTCCYSIVGQTQDLQQTVPIGRPIANTQVYILDSQLQPVPIGVAGELHIGGDGLARGYLNRPELTQAKFVANPFSPDRSTRLYKTGDLARYLPDGNIEFLGRIDHQVKIRGFRIELGEIEAVLSSHPQIQQAVVIATEDIAQTKRLVAYAVSEEETLSTQQLREFLHQQIPAYMVPSAFVILDTLPLTPNGKVDRKALPALDGEIERTQEYVAPRTEIEQTLTAIWQELLLVDRVSIHDNFFESGGDSILSIQVVSRAKTAGVQITPKQLFQHQTIAALARVANTTQMVNARQGLVTGSAPLTPIQHVFWAHNSIDPHHYNQSVLLQTPPGLSSEFIATACQKLLEHHDALRLRFPTSATEHQQINHGLEETVPFAIVDLSTTPIPEQPQALEQIATSAQASLNLSTGPIMQIVMFDLGHQREGQLLIVIHHLAVDGVSWRILLSDLEIIYQQLTTQQPIQLSPKTTAFIDWAEKLDRYAQSELLKLELDYWLDQPWEQATPIPLDLTSQTADNTIGSSDSVAVTLSATATYQLLGSVHEAYNTQINDLLLTGLAMTLAQWTGNAAVPINLEGHGREELFEDVDLSRTVGWFTSLFPVLLQLPPSTPPATAIKSIKEQLRTIPQRGIGYGILRYLCADEEVKEQLQRIPSPEISFNYLGQFDQVQSETGWKFASEATGKEQSSQHNREHRLDLSCLVVGGELQIDWTYSSQVHQRETISDLAQSYLQNLTVLIEHCQSEDACGYTPSDFPEAQLEQSELDELLAPISAKNIEAIYPLSPMQQGMLFHSLYAPESGVYVEQMTLTLKGDVNVAAFESAWQKVVDRYSILRTLFIWENRPTPLQIVLKQVDLPWTNLDWLSLSPAAQQQQLSELLHTQRTQGFAFDRAPLMGCTLIQLTDDTYQLIWNFHHILLDGWCLPIIFKEVLSFYEAQVQGEICHLPTPAPYRDYITWLNAQDRAASTEFWQQMLQGFSAPTPLVVGRTVPQSQQPDSNYRELELRLSVDVSHKLQALAQQHHVTLSTIIQAAWGLLLSRYSGEQDILFGVTVSGRPASLDGVEKMVGLFINTLPLRLHISPNQQLISWLEQIQQLMLELQQFSYTPLVEIQSLSEVVGGIPLFESIVVFENYPMDSSLDHETGSLQVGKIESREQTNFPLTVVAAPGNELSVQISYDAVRFAEDTIERMLGHLQTIFSAIATNSHQTLGELPLLSESERHQLLFDWNDTARKYPQDKCIHQLFEEQVTKTPDAIAVVFEREELTYQQLNERANQLAHYLQTLGVKPEVLVGICVERSLEMVVGLLGILKAGGAYVPLDPSYPTERLSYMVSDAGVKVLLTQENLLSTLPSHVAQVVCVNTDGGVIESHSPKNLVNDVRADNLAYVIYTSGSTGEPKGVCVAHRSVVRLVQNTNYAQFNAEQVFLQLAPITFDASTLELWGSLLHGSKLVIFPSQVPDLDLLVDVLYQHQITCLWLTAGLFHLMVDEYLEALSPVQQLLAGGDVLSVDHVQRFRQRYPNCRLIDGYGPTENTTFTCCYSIVGQTQDLQQTVPIGRPIANTQVYILDSQLQPVPIGVAGELHIGGDGLARGYLNRPELTQAKFVANPFSPDRSTRLYKTGDLARYLPDGNIEFLGRIDHQVKIRGFRIELGEIEAVLSSHPQIQQVVVIATATDAAGNQRLVAYVVSEKENLSSQQLREFLKQQLPTYMVPSAFVILDTLPLTPNGKVDRKALPTLDGEIDRVRKYAAPLTPNEEIIARIFGEVLGIETVSIHDNFFELGGHSLLATQLISRLRQALQIDLSVRILFETSTVAGLANCCDIISWTNQQTQVSDNSNDCYEEVNI